MRSMILIFILIAFLLSFITMLRGLWGEKYLTLFSPYSCEHVNLLNFFLLLILLDVCINAAICLWTDVCIV